MGTLRHAAATSNFARDDFDRGAVSDEPLPFFMWLDGQARAIRRQGDDRSTWLAGKIDEMMRLAFYLHASSPQQYEDRVDVLESDRPFNRRRDD